MDNTKDTPKDYKTPYQLLEDNHANPEMLYKMHSPDGVRLSHGKRIEKAMQEYSDQQTESLKLELQKQKELNAELVEVLDHFYSYGKIHSMNYSDKNKIESLIKKSSEI